jgi:hypothetical protein
MGELLVGVRIAMAWSLTGHEAAMTGTGQRRLLALRTLVGKDRGVEVHQFGEGGTMMTGMITRAIVKETIGIEIATESGTEEETTEIGITIERETRIGTIGVVDLFYMLHNRYKKSLSKALLMCTTAVARSFFNIT